MNEPPPMASFLSIVVVVLVVVSWRLSQGNFPNDLAADESYEKRLETLADHWKKRSLSDFCWTCCCCCFSPSSARQHIRWWIIFLQKSGVSDAICLGVDSIAWSATERGCVARQVVHLSTASSTRHATNNSTTTKPTTTREWKRTKETTANECTETIDQVDKWLCMSPNNKLCHWQNKSNKIQGFFFANDRIIQFVQFSYLFRVIQLLNTDIIIVDIVVN